MIVLVHKNDDKWPNVTPVQHVDVQWQKNDIYFFQRFLTPNN